MREDVGETHLVEALSGALLDTAAGQGPEANMTGSAPATARLLLAVLHQRSEGAVRHHRPGTGPGRHLYGCWRGGGAWLGCWGRRDGQLWLSLISPSLLVTVKTQLCPGLVYLSLLLVISGKNVIGKDKIGVLSKPSIKPRVAEK